MLHSQRRMAAAVVTPAGATGGQNVDIAFIVADESLNGCTDPAYEAHVQPIIACAKAIWEGLFPLRQMLQLAAAAKVKLTRATSPWKAVRGPAAAFIATAARWAWHVHDATTITTHDGEYLNFRIDPAEVTKRHVMRAVRARRWRRVAYDHPTWQQG